MYRVLVVDDEDIVTDSLAYLLETQEGMELDVYKAYSAMQALELLGKIAFDIIVSDIQMPGMDGLALLAQIKAVWPTCQVIFLTGYDEFDYAYRAIQLGASKFVLKNEGDDVLLLALAECVERIEQEAHNGERLWRAEQEVRTYRPVIRRELMRSLLMGEAVEESALMREFAKLEIGLNLERPVLLLAASVDAPHVEGMAEAVDIVLRSRIHHAIECELGWAGLPLLAWLMQPLGQEGVEQACVVVRGMAEIVRRECAGLLGASVTLVLDAQATAWGELPQRFAYVREIIEREFGGSSEIALAELAYFVDRAGDAREGEGAQAIERLQRYIKDNLDADLSLCALSERVYLNPSYLSRRFKELTGGNLTEYITELRVAQAQQLLLDRRNKVSEVATMVGYESAAHFSRVFRRQTGMTPQMYRGRQV